MFARSEGGILFIDELDALGNRNQLSTAIHKWYVESITHILSKMDGFVSKDNRPIIIGATNGVGVIDAGLLRSGRFDVVLELTSPSCKTREGLLEFYSKPYRHQDIKFGDLAAMTINATHADMRCLPNIAALRAFANGKDKIEQVDFLAAVEQLQRQEKLRKRSFLLNK
jgi:ATP-dependent 26S proteasome regulatory subunit